MKIEEAIEQLEDLKKDRDRFARHDDDFDGVFAKEVKAIDIAVKTLEENQELLSENKELKRLLRSAVEDMKNVSDDNCCYHCVYGDPITRRCEKYKRNANCYKWQHADEALKLIGGGENA